MVSSCVSSEGLPPPEMVPPGLCAVEVAGMVDTASVRFDGQSVTPLPPRPSEHHRFDHAALKWKLDMGRAINAMRERRNRLLAASDPVVLRAVETGQGVPQEWTRYRQALRDLPAAVTDEASLLTAPWPAAPTA
ncbi:MAG: phage tail assembly chaperone [Burkholderiaceae bacterium]|nr:phage tail assembly chaperone [Burkholderiaceae bacterium]